MIKDGMIILRGFVCLVGFFSLWACLSLLEAVFWMQLIGFATLLISLFRPSWALSLFLFLIPLVGVSFPGTSQNLAFYQVFGALTLGHTIRYFHEVKKGYPFPFRIGSIPTLWAVGVFFATGVLSLSSLPWDEVIVRWHQLKPDKTLGFLSLKETWALYPLLKVLTQFQGFFFFLLLLDYPRNWNPAPMIWLRAMLIGVLLTAGLGLLDYYGIINLVGLRAIATGTGPDGHPLRLQSTWGHPAWCAMYFAIAIPSVLSLLEVKWPRLLKVSLVLAVLVLGEYVLILTFARGSWLTYPFTLLAIWFCVYMLRQDLNHQAFWKTARRSFKKIALSLPITILISLALVRWVGGEMPDRYVQRFKDISKATDRTAYIRPALDLTWQHPVLGGGMDSFTYRYAQEFILPTGRHAGDGNPLGNTFNNAHSAYLEILQGTGFFGLMAFLTLIGLSLTTLIWIIRDGFFIKVEQFALERPQKIQVVFGLCLIVSYSVYGLFDDVFYTPALSTLFFLGLGLSHQGIPAPFRVIQGGGKKVIGITLGIFLIHLFWEYGYPGETLRVIWPTPHVGCYSSDSRGLGGKSGVWCSRAFTAKAPVISVNQTSYAFLNVIPIRGPMGLESVTIRIRKGSEQPVSMKVPTGVPSWVILPLSSPKVGAAFEEIQIESEDPSVVPALDPGQASLDRRQLSFFTPELQDPWEISRDAAGCQSWSADNVLCPNGGQWPPGGGQADVTFHRVHFADSLLSQDNPLWVWTRSAGGEFHLVKVIENRWYDLIELGISTDEITQSRLHVSRLGRFENTELMLPESQGRFAFVLSRP